MGVFGETAFVVDDSLNNDVYVLVDETVSQEQ